MRHRPAKPLNNAQMGWCFRLKNLKMKQLKKSFWIGAGSVFNVFGDCFSYDLGANPKQTDLNSIAQDWRMVGGDFKKVFQIFQKRKTNRTNCVTNRKK